MDGIKEKRYGKTQLESWKQFKNLMQLRMEYLLLQLIELDMKRKAIEKEFWGHSLVIDPNGKIILKSKEDVLVLTLIFR